MSTDPKRKSVMVVDDIESIRFALAEHLSAHYEVSQAKNGRDALRQLERSAVDLVITDIRMPQVDGLELIAQIQRDYPDTRYALMTAYDTDDYIQFVREQRIWNVIPKTTLLDLRFVEIMARKLLTDEIFGVEQYCSGFERRTLDLPGLADLRKPGAFERNVLYCFDIASPEHYEKLSERTGEILAEHGAPTMILQILEELLSNAVVRAPGAARKIPGEQAVTGAAVSVFRDPEAQSPPPGPYELQFGLLGQEGADLAVAVIDPHGSLRREDILYRLERQVKLGDDGLPIGIHDDHGRGLFISREHMDHLVFNIHPGRRTEVIGLLTIGRDRRYRAVSIYQT